MSDCLNYKVYCYTGPTGYKYIGITNQSLRCRAGVGGVGYKSCIRFWRAIQKYGWDSFSSKILYSGISFEEACRHEIELIQHCKALGISYNIANGGQGCPGRKLSDETKLKISKANKGRKRGEHTRKLLSESHRGLKNASGKRTPEQCERIRNAVLARYKCYHKKQKIKSPKKQGMLGRHHTEESKRKIALANIGKHNFHHTEESKRKIALTSAGRKHSESTRCDMIMISSYRGWIKQMNKLADIHQQHLNTLYNQDKSI